MHPPAPEQPRTRTTFARSGLVLVVYHRDGLELVVLEASRAIVVGRTEPSDIRPRSRRLSRRHAQFEWVDGGVWVEDLGSSNGTFVGGERIRERTLVPVGTEVSLGSVIVVPHLLSERWLRAVGLPGHPRFEICFDAEIERAETFGRMFALLMFRARDPRGPHLPGWVPYVAEHLRGVDRLTVFGPDSVLVLLPEMNAEQASSFGRGVVHALTDRTPLTFGVASFPEGGRTQTALTEAVRCSVLRTLPATESGDPLELPLDIEPRAHGSAEDGPVVCDPAVVALYRTIDRVAPSNISVLLVGETGTGKEVLARALHHRSARAEGPLRVVNCGAIPPTLVESTLFGHERGAFTGADRRRVGVFEEAHHGTVFLDEVGELPLPVQVALLRVLETRRIQRVGSSQEIEVDVRVVAATHRDLEAMCDDRTFRWDLLYRLNGITLRIPPLRERPTEIRPLVARFVRESNRVNGRAVRGIAPEVLYLLERYPWPGNVRELRNTVDRAVVVASGEVVTVDDLPERLTRAVDTAHVPTEITTPPEPVPDPGFPGTDLKARVRAFEKALIRNALASAEGNQTRAAQILAMPRRTLVYKLRAYQMDSADVPQGNGSPDLVDAVPFAVRVDRFERESLEEALACTGGDRRAAARLLNIQVRTLEQKLGRARSG